jgi:hypothetical protein
MRLALSDERVPEHAPFLVHGILETRSRVLPADDPREAKRLDA